MFTRTTVVARPSLMGPMITHALLVVLRTRPLPSAALDVFHQEHTEGSVWPLCHSYCDIKSAHSSLYTDGALTHRLTSFMTDYHKTQRVHKIHNSTCHS